MGDTRKFELPDVGEGVAEGEIIEWHVEEGERVTEDQTIIEVETDKAVVDIPSPVDGTVRSRRYEEGDVVPVGDVLITFETDDESDAASETTESTATTDDGTSAADESASTESDQSGADGAATDDFTAGVASNGQVFARPSVRRLARERGVDLATVAEHSGGPRVSRRDVLAVADEANIGEGASSVPTSPTYSSDDGSETRPTADATSETAAAETGPSEPAPDRASAPGGSAVAATSANAAKRDRTLAMPATRKRARGLGVSIDDVPTDETRDGEAFVTPEALESFAAAQERGRQDDGDRAAQVASQSRERRVPYTGIRRTIGERMEQSMYTAPQVSHHDTIDASELVETRERLKPTAEERGINLTYLPFVMKACVAALKEYPVLNAELDEENEEIIEKHYYNFGVATDTDAGLMVPVIEDVDRKNILEIAGEMTDVVERARDRSITREELEGGTFTVTNIGGIGGKFGTPILNYPEVGILALGSLEEQPRVVDGEVVPRHVLPISLTSDHRVVDGGDAARFTNELKRYLENPSLLLLE